MPSGPSFVRGLCRRRFRESAVLTRQETASACVASRLWRSGETGGRQEGDRRETGGRQEGDRRETGGRQEGDRKGGSVVGARRLIASACAEASTAEFVLLREALDLLLPVAGGAAASAPAPPPPPSVPRSEQLDKRFFGAFQTREPAVMFWRSARLAGNMSSSTTEINDLIPFSINQRKFKTCVAI